MSGMGTAAGVLRARRRAAGLSQEQLAERCHLSVRTVRNLERGLAKRPHRDTLLVIAGALGMSGLVADEFVASWRSPGPGEFLARKAREDELARELFSQRRQVREILVGHVLVVGDRGRWDYEVTRRTFEARQSGVDTFAWMASFDADAALIDPDRMSAGACVNVEVASATVLPVTGAKAFVGTLGGPLDLGEIRTIEYRVDHAEIYLTAERGAGDDEILFAVAPGLELLTVEVRFDPAALPARVFAIRRSSAEEPTDETDADTDVEVRCSPFGIAELVVRPASNNVYGLRWEWAGTT